MGERSAGYQPIDRDQISRGVSPNLLDWEAVNGSGLEASGVAVCLSMIGTTALWLLDAAIVSGTMELTDSDGVVGIITGMACVALKELAPKSRSST
jgi:hypothetical protein